MNKNPLALFGLKWNPFSPDVPVEALFVTPEVRNFCWRVENLVREGGFALIAGAPGTGKSVAVRLLAERLASLRDVVVGAVEHPRSRTADFYRELGHLFGVPLAPHNRWGGFKALRDKWHAHIENTTVRPVLLIDESQEMPPPAFAELRLLASSHFDSRSLLTVVLVGDHRLPELLRSAELLPLASRIRVRLNVEPAVSSHVVPQFTGGVFRHWTPGEVPWTGAQTGRV
jgi:general secretion pathway protein A